MYAISNTPYLKICILLSYTSNRLHLLKSGAIFGKYFSMEIVICAGFKVGFWQQCIILSSRRFSDLLAILTEWIIGLIFCSWIPLFVFFSIRILSIARNSTIPAGVFLFRSIVFLYELYSLLSNTFLYLVTLDKRQRYKSIWRMNKKNK